MYIYVYNIQFYITETHVPMLRNVATYDGFWSLNSDVWDEFWLLKKCMYFGNFKNSTPNCKNKDQNLLKVITFLYKGKCSDT